MSSPSIKTLTRTLVEPFRFMRVDAHLDWRCAACGYVGVASVPVLVDWCDRRGAQEQRRAADGLTCPACDALRPLELPLLQYRRGDGVGLLVGLPAPRAQEGCAEWIRDILLAAQAQPGDGEAAAPDLDGAEVVVSVPLGWWGPLWNRPLAPRLLGLLPLQLPASAEEAEHWRGEALHQLDLPDVPGALAAFLVAEDRDAALGVADQHSALLQARWRLTVQTLLALHREQQLSAAAAEALDDRAALLRQAGIFGLDHLRRIFDDTELRGQIDVAASARDPAARLVALRAAIDAADSSDSPLRVVAYNAYVQALHGDAGRRAVADSQLLRVAEQAVEVATLILGPAHELTLAARLNHAVCVEECAGGDQNTGVEAAAALLGEIAPLAALSGADALVDVAINYATLVARAPGTYAENPDAAAELLADAQHIGALLSHDNRRATLTTLVDEAAAIRTKRSGSPRANAARAIELLDRAIELEEEWQILSPPEKALIAMNRSNALTQLHEHAPQDAPVEAVREAARVAIAAAAELDPLHPVAIDALSNVGATLVDLYVETRGPRALWEEARDVLGRAVAAAAEAFPPHHPVALRADLHLAAAYGCIVDGEVADRARAVRLLQSIVDHARDAQFTMTAASNLGQVRSGEGEWSQAAADYTTAAAAHEELLVGARTQLGRLGVIASLPDLAARRALALALDKRPAEAIAVLEANRARLTGRPRPAALEPAAGTAVLHLATSDHGTVGIVTLPGGRGETFAGTLASATLKPLLAAVLDAADATQRRERLDALLAPLRQAVIEPVAEILSSELVDELAVIACGTLASCPLHAALDGEGRRWIDRYTVRYRISATPPQATPPAAGKVIAVIDPDGTLPFARTERAALKAWASELVEPPAGADTARWLLRNLPDASTAHLACHAGLDPEDPMRSAFRLGPDREITVADLAGIATPQLALVVAPACQSAAAGPGTPDELLGVGHALAHAGARVVIASLWDADDAVTALVVSRLYAELSDGVGPAQALTRAQRYVSGITGPGLRALAKARLQDRPEAAWLPYNLAIELSALSVHPDFRSAVRPCFGHPADWAVLSCLEA